MLEIVRLYFFALISFVIKKKCCWNTLDIENPISSFWLHNILSQTES